jgi:hypothetical protein
MIESVASLPVDPVILVCAGVIGVAIFVLWSTRRRK